MNGDHRQTGRYRWGRGAVVGGGPVHGTSGIRGNNVAAAVVVGCADSGGIGRRGWPQRWRRPGVGNRDSGLGGDGGQRSHGGSGDDSNDHVSGVMALRKKKRL